ncbi:MAG: Lrp/AsnC family transcriptional regulator [Candidatus Bathyarchaeia archaeon]|jgi:Lrp/AsnC family transcriptional regulator for asnA, asnC and gidA
MKKIDNEILTELLKDPQASFSEVAKKLNISQNTLKKKYEKLIKEKIILCSFVTINLEKIGYQGRIKFTIKTTQKASTIEALKKIPSVVVVAETFGDYDVIAFAVVKDYNSMIKVTEEIKNIPTIIQADVALEKTTHYPVSQQFNHLTIQ